MTALDSSINPQVAPSGNGCVDCDADGGWWVHLRRCAECGHIGCCDDSLGRHATAHYTGTGHRVVQSFEPGEDWFWDYADETFVQGPPLAPPHNYPAGQGAPGPADRLPADWRTILAGG